MVKTPRTRHSRTEREPQTIELGPDEVSRLEGEAARQTDAAPGEAEASAGPSSDEKVSGAPETDTGTEPAAKEFEAVQTQAARAGEAAGPASPASSSASSSGPRPAAETAAKPTRGSALGAGLVGGIVALAAAGALQYAGLLGAPGATQGAVTPSVPEEVTEQIAGLRSEIEALKAATPPDIGGVTSQVEGLSQALDAVRADVASLKEAVESGGAGESAAVDALNTKIAEIESRIAAIGPGEDTAGAEDIAALGERIASVETLAKAASEAGTGLAGRLGALEQSVSTLAGKVDAQAGQPKIALAIAASALKSAIERGAPFQSEIETLAAIAPDAPGLGELRSYAENGVATRADLIAETDAAAKAMIAAANPPPANAGFFERLLSSAESLVSVRPIGAVEGPGVPETVARMEVALKAGDLAQAIAEFDTLPEAAKAAGAPFADKVRARLAVEQLADQAIAAAMQAA